MDHKADDDRIAEVRTQLKLFETPFSYELWVRYNGIFQESAPRYLTWATDRLESLFAYVDDLERLLELRNRSPEEVREILARELAMHVAASGPISSLPRTVQSDDVFTISAKPTMTPHRGRTPPRFPPPRT